MNQLFRRTALALAVTSTGLVAMSAQAVQISFSGSSNIDDLETVTGDDGIGDAWQTHNDPVGGNANFAMADFEAAPQPFNPTNFNNSNGNFALAFQLTINQSQAPEGFKGILSTGGSSPLPNNFTVKPDLGDPGTWIEWDVKYFLPDANTGLFQQVLFTAPTGTELAQGMNFSTNINISGIFTADAGWAASFIDDAAVIASIGVGEPVSMALLGLGLLVPIAARRRKAA